MRLGEIAAWLRWPDGVWWPSRTHRDDGNKSCVGSGSPQFLGLSASPASSGSSSSELAIYLGYVRAGWPGLLVGGSCFIVPAAALVTAIAWTYARFGSLPEIAGMLYGIRPFVVAIIIQALWRLGQAAIKDATSAVVTIVAVALSVVGLSPLVVLLISGSAVAAVWTARGAAACECYRVLKAESDRFLHS